MTAHFLANESLLVDWPKTKLKKPPTNTPTHTYALPRQSESPSRLAQNNFQKSPTPTHLHIPAHFLASESLIVDWPKMKLKNHPRTHAHPHTYLRTSSPVRVSFSTSPTYFFKNNPHPHTHTYLRTSLPVRVSFSTGPKQN